MPNNYLVKPPAASNHTLARGTDLNNVINSVDAAFDRVPDEARLKEGRVTYAKTAGGAYNVYVVTLHNPVTAYSEGLRFSFKAPFANTGPATINVDSVGAVGIKRFNGGDLLSGDIPQDAIVELLHDGTQFQLIAPIADGASAAAAASQTAANASTADQARIAAEAARDAAAAAEANAGGYSSAAGAAALQALSHANAADVAKIEWRGPWSDTTAYSVRDAVSHGGASYICNTAHINQPPPDTDYWDLLAEKGAVPASLSDLTDGQIATQQQANTGDGDGLITAEILPAAVAALTPPPPPPPVIPSVLPGMIIERRLPTGTNGGSGSSGWSPVELNSLLRDLIPGSGFAAPDITLPAGDYYFTAEAQAVNARDARLRLYNINDNELLVTGLSIYDNAGETVYNITVAGAFTLIGTRTLQLQYRLESPSSGFVFQMGSSNGFGPHETYNRITIWKG